MLMLLLTVAWEDLDHALKQELGRRKDWVVYVAGDDSKVWGNVADVVDAARSWGAKAFLITATPGAGLKR